MTERWDPNISLEEARQLCRNLPRKVAQKVRLLNQVAGEPAVAGGGRYRLGVNATGKVEVQRLVDSEWVRDMGDKPTGP